MSTISIRVNHRDSELIRKYAKLKNTSVSELVRNAVIEKIEEELDADLFEQALTPMERIYTLDEAKKELGLQ